MYFIIGGDGKQYGPITDADMRQWISEGRLNAQSLAKAESDAELRPLGAFPEFADAVGVEASLSSSSSGANMSDWADHDYQLDIGRCIGKGWELFKNNLGMLIGCLLLYGLIMAIAGGILNAISIAVIPKAAFQSTIFKIVFSIIDQFIFAALFGPLTGGFYYVFIQAIRGRPSLADLFSGFQRAYAHLFLGQFVISFLTGLCLIPFTIVESSKIQPILDQFSKPTTPDQIQNLMPQLWSGLSGAFPVLFLCVIPVTYFMVSFQFTLPLIIDKRITVGAGIKTSFRMVHKHWWTIFGLVIVADLISVAGALLCCVGVLFTMPIGMGALMVAYETIFGESRSA